jgi:hypothetical protein
MLATGRKSPCSFPVAYKLSSHDQQGASMVASRWPHRLALAALIQSVDFAGCQVLADANLGVRSTCRGNCL